MEPMDIDTIPKKRKYIPVALKKDCWNKCIGKDIGSATCPVCMTDKIYQNDFQCGHIISEYNNGPTIITNLIPLCKKCNSSMSKNNLLDYVKNYYTHNTQIYNIIHSISLLN